ATWRVTAWSSPPMWTNGRSRPFGRGNARAPATRCGSPSWVASRPSAFAIPCRRWCRWTARKPAARTPCSRSRRWERRAPSFPSPCTTTTRRWRRSKSSWKRAPRSFRAPRLDGCCPDSRSPTPASRRVFLMKSTIALVGMPGSGKSTVGKQLARRLQLEFVDSDHLIEERLGCPIRTYFEREGEEAFRGVEQSVIDELTRRDGLVLSTGGGSVLRQENRRYLHDRCLVVYLRSSPEEVFRRVRHDRNRPLLQVSDPMQALRDMYQVRDPLYRQTAHFVIDTGRPSVATLVNMII